VNGKMAKVTRNIIYFCIDCETRLTAEETQKHLDKGHIIRVLNVKVTEVKQ
jgi:uncharacterized protein YlaI